MVATNSQSRCREQGIPFYRFSPKLRDVIAGSETDNEKLFNMVIQTRIDTREQGMEEVVHLFHTIAGASHHLAPRIEKETVINQHKHDHHHQQVVQEEKPELNANLNNQRGLLQAPPSSSSSQPVLSDIEESVENSSKTSYKLPSVPQQPSALATFMVGELETQDTAQVSTQTAAASGSNECESERDGPAGEQEVRWLKSTNTNIVGGEKNKHETDRFSNQLVAEKESQAHGESPQNETDVTQSQNSSIFSAELARPNELGETSLPQENDDDDNGLNTKPHGSPDSQSSKHANTVEDVAVKGAVTSPSEPVAPPTDHAVPSLVKLEEEEVGGPLFTLEQPKESSNVPTSHPVELKESIEDHSTLSVASQQSAEDLRMPPGQVESEEKVEDLSTNDQPSVAILQEHSSQETHESALDDANSLAAAHQLSSNSSSRSSTSHDWVITLEKFAGEEKQEVCSHQMKQKGLNKATEESPDSAINGGSVIGVSIPMGSSHSSFISLESPQIDGPPKKKIPRTANDERDIPNGDAHFMSSTAAEQHSNEIHSTASLVNGCKSLTQVENGTKGHEEVPNHYKLDIQLTPEMRQDVQCKFPYRFETEI